MHWCALPVARVWAPCSIRRRSAWTSRPASCGSRWAIRPMVSRGSSLLAVGIRQVDGEFAEGDVLDVCDPSGMVVARGIAEADSDVLELAAGRRQDQIASNRLLADLAEKPAIHRDNLIVFA